LDSLQSVYNEYRAVLLEYARIENTGFDPDLSSIQAIINKSQQRDFDFTITDSIKVEYELEPEEQKKGLFKRIFGKKKKEEEDAIAEIIIKDSVRIDSITYTVSSDSLIKKDEVLESLEDMMSNLEYQFTQKSQQNLLTESRLISEISQLKIIISEYLAFIESREIKKAEIEKAKTREQLTQTQYQVSQFSFILGAFIFLVFLGLLIFLNQNRRFQKLLMLARERAEEYARTKQMFMANMSHEIRTPMNAIIGFTEQLSKSELTEEQKEKVKIIHQSSDHLLHLLNSILDISKFQSNTIKLDTKPVNILELARDCVKLMEIKSRKKGIDLKFIEAGIENEFLMGDPYRIRQVILNLLSNAIKFTSKGQVSLTISVEKIKKDLSKLSIKVQDTGIGIPVNKRQLIFKEFEQLNTSQKFSGTGLGLSIVKYIVDLYGGHIKVESVEGKGATFKINLPLKVASEKDIESDSIKEKEQFIPENLRILVADDEPYNRKLLGEILSGHRYAIDFADNGKQALDLLCKNAYDIAFLDIKMPKLKGDQVVKAYREITENKYHTQFIAVSATTNDEYLRSTEFDAYVRKPIKEKDILNLLGEEKSTADEIANPVNKNGSVISLQSLMEIGNEDFVRKMIETYVKSPHRQLNNIEELLSGGDYLQIAEQIHKIKGPSRHLEAVSFIKVLEKLEKKSKENKNIKKEEFAELREEFDNIKKQVEIKLNVHE
jgi:signal transduction histidine kinase/CheY-like chemotaxis protein